ncbi:hypothetical protein [Arthrobacter sp. UYCo732]|uniref:hypothetical protein n=1 Tax=Arthrobacter sp. UYCo732 TaxID=3156336 RepID=UPI003390F7D2
MNAALVFKTKKPQLIADYLAKREKVVSDWQAKVDAFKASIGGREVFGTSFFDGGWAVAGYRAAKYGEELPAGWRFDGARLDVVPAKRTPEGKGHVATLAGLRLPGNTFPGCPDILFAEGFGIFPRVETVGGDHFLTLSRVPLEDQSKRIDQDIWEQVKLSEFHAALEAETETAQAA